MWPRVVQTALFGLALLTTGCGALFQGEPQSEAMDTLVSGSQMSVGELRVRVRALAAPLSGELESAAEEISRVSEGDAAQAMTRFKIESIPAMQAALFQPDPVAALVDAWAFVAQLRHIVVRLEGTALGEEALAVADDRFLAMERQLAGLWAALTGRQDTSGARAQIHAWAAENPVGEIAVRPSTAPLLSAITGTSGLSPMGAAAQLVETTQDLSARADLLTAWFPKLARWQMEYFTRQMITDSTLLGDERRAMSELVGTVGDLPDLAADVRAAVAEEREAVFDAVSGERTAMQGFVREERQAVVSELRDERVLFYDFLREERDTTLDRLDAMVRGWIHRVFLLSLLVLLFGALAGLLVLASLRRRRRRRRFEHQPIDAPA